MQTFVICKGCGVSKPHHARDYCTNCYYKFIVRGTGDFNRGDHDSYQQHLASIKEKISATQKARRKGPSIVTELSKERLEQLYCEQKLSLGDIAIQFNCSRTYISSLLKKYNLPARSKSSARAEAKKKGKNVGFSAINEDFFKNQTPEMAYVLGFIYSDGNLGNLLDHFSISQKEPEILYKIRGLMSSEHKIVRKTKQDLHILTIGNKVMINDLLALGLTPNKSLDLKFPILDEALYRHFIRGYFDGDGSIFLDRKSYKINFVSGSKGFITKLEEVLYQYVNVTKRPIYNNSNAYQLTYQKKEDLVKICKFIYEGLKDELFLSRKHEHFIKVLA